MNKERNQNINIKDNFKSMVNQNDLNKKEKFKSLLN